MDELGRMLVEQREGGGNVCLVSFHPRRFELEIQQSLSQVFHDCLPSMLSFSLSLSLRPLLTFPRSPTSWFGLIWEDVCRAQVGSESLFLSSEGDCTSMRSTDADLSLFLCRMLLLSTSEERACGDQHVGKSLSMDGWMANARLFGSNQWVAAESNASFYAKIKQESKMIKSGGIFSGTESPGVPLVDVAKPDASSAAVLPSVGPVEVGVDSGAPSSLIPVVSFCPRVLTLASPVVPVDLSDTVVPAVIVTPGSSDTTYD